MSSKIISDSDHGFGHQHTTAHNDYVSRRGPAARRKRAEERAKIATVVKTDEQTPLHPNALRMSDIVPGRRIITFNLERGILDEGIVIVGPHAYKSVHHDRYPNGELVVTIEAYTRFMTGVRQDEHFCSDMGLQRYGGKGNWNDRNFTIDVKDRHLLPAPDPSLHRPLFDDVFDDFDYIDYITDHV